MRAFRYVDDAIQEEKGDDWQRPHVRLLAPSPPEEFARFLRRQKPKRERRRLARAGRRFPVRVPAWKVFGVPDREIITLEGHVVAYGDARFALFLPSGEAVTDQHLADLRRFLLRDGWRPTISAPFWGG